MPQFKLIYFPIMGRAEPIRLTFAQAGVPYDDHRISFEDWGTLKPQMPMGSVPVLEVDGKQLCQTSAICGYLGSLYSGAEDLWVAMTPYFLEKDTEKKKTLLETYIEKHLKPFMARFDKFLAENGTGYLVGNSITWVDLVLYHGSVFVLHLCKENCKESDYGNLRKFISTIENLPKIKQWLEKRPKTEW